MMKKILWSWTQRKFLKSWLYRFTLISSCVKPFWIEHSFWCYSHKKQNKRKPQGGGDGREWKYIPGAHVPAAPWRGWGHCPAYWPSAACQPPAPRLAGSSSGSFLSDLGMIPHWFIGLQFSKWHHTPFFFFSYSFPLLISLLLNSHLSRFHFPVLWNGNSDFQLPSSAVRISCLLTPSPVAINKGDTAAWHGCRPSPTCPALPFREQEAAWPRSPCLWHLPPAHISHPCVLLHTQLKTKGPNEKCQPEGWPGGTQISDQLTTAPYLLIPSRKERRCHSCLDWFVL